MKDAALKNECWHLLCHRSELPKHNDFLRLSWFGDDVVVFNDAGDLTVFDNLCPHRGTRFFVDSCGNAPALCPYHGWRYRNGQVHVARKEKFPDCDFTAIGLNRHLTEWVGDFLFAAISPRSSLDEQLAGLGPSLERISADITGRYDFNECPFECNWRVPVENALEPYHVDMIHPGSLGSLKLTEGNNEYFGRNSVWRAEVGDSRAARHLQSLGRFFNLTSQFVGYESIYIFPFAMLSSTFGYSYSLQQFLPDENANRTNFSSRLLISRVRDAAAGTALEAFFDSTAKMNRQVFEEDHQICRRVSKTALDWNRPAVLATTEAKISHFREDYQSFFRPQSKGNV